MTGPLSRLRPRWQVLRKRRPLLAARAEEVALAVRGRDSLAAEVHALRSRLAELERDHLLLAAHVAALTERVAAADAAVLPPDDADARQRARLTAIAFYEERIGALEDVLRSPRHARRGAARATIGRTSAERGTTR